jgi:hypothetical protein
MDKIKYIDYEEKNLIERRLWWQKQNLSYTASGYGKKIPTTKMLKIGKKLYRIYCMIYSNSGSCYIEKNKQKFFLLHL